MSVGHCGTQDLLIDHLKYSRQFDWSTNSKVEQVLRAVDRAYFIAPDTPTYLAYLDRPLPIGCDQTISAPHMHAACLQLLGNTLRPGARVLDAGSGSGYLTACMGLMVGEEGYVLGVEMHEELAQRSVASIRACCPELLAKPVVRILAGNVLGAALEEEPGFDAIHVGAASEELPELLLAKLNPNGMMVCPVGPVSGSQQLMVFWKDGSGNVRQQSLMGVRYVPLVKPLTGARSRDQPVSQAPLATAPSSDESEGPGPEGMGPPEEGGSEELEGVEDTGAMAPGQHRGA